ISKKEKTMDLIEKISPDYVVHAAALTNVDYCEGHPDEAAAINAEGTRNVALGCKKVSAKMAYVSTDFVFDGKKGEYIEENEVNPQSLYAKSKLLGELALQEVGIDYVIGRTSVLYGWHPRNFNFVMWVIEKLEKEEEITIVTDQFNSPTLADNLAEMLLDMRDKSGLYHTCGSERISRYDFAQKIAEVFELDENLIKPITSESLIQAAPRPMDSSLSVLKAQKELGVKALNIYEGLQKMSQLKK
ncbi:MAG: dTDP-4-dehydrorhamnose reductase, partial [Candidatus Altiarchaeota archaeon]